MATKKLPPLGTAGPVKRRVLWVCLFLCLGGASLVCIGGKPCLKAWQARDWIATPCTVDNSGINSTFKPGQKELFSFFASFRYSFNGQDFHSATPTFYTGEDMDQGAVDALSNRFPKDAHTTCWVNPQQPSEAVLDRSIKPRDLYATLGGVLLVLVSFAASLAARKKGRGR